MIERVKFEWLLEFKLKGLIRYNLDYAIAVDDNNIMLQPNEQSIFKIDGVITDIRMINLHLHNYLIARCDNKEPSNFNEYNISHFKQYAKRVSQYLKKTFKDALRTKVTLSPLAFRFFRPKFKLQNFLRFENTNFGLKFVFTDFEREAHMHLELYRKLRGGRCSTLALRKLELYFLLEISLKMGQGIITIDELQHYGKNFLEELTDIMGGVKCEACSNHLGFNTEYMCYLPPTVREVVDSKESKELKEFKQAKKTAKVYFHEGCLTI